LISVTLRAKAGLSQYLAEQKAEAGMAVKLVPIGRGGVDMVIAAPSGGDEVVCRDEKPLLIVDRRLVEPLNGAVFDLATDLRPGETPEFTVAPKKGRL
jgi:hypothetical protein